MPLEFRVRWQREGRHPKTLIYQSWDSAVRKVRHLKALDAVKADYRRYEGMPDLESGPVLQVREVGGWRVHDYQPDATDRDREGMREWAEIHEPSSPAEDAGMPF